MAERSRQFFGEASIAFSSVVLSHLTSIAFDEAFDPLDGIAFRGRNTKELTILPDDRRADCGLHLLVEVSERPKAGLILAFLIGDERRGHEVKNDIQASVVHDPNFRLAC